MTYVNIDVPSVLVIGIGAVLIIQGVRYVIGIVF